MLDTAIKNKKAVSDLASGKGSTDAEKKQASKRISTFDEKIKNIREALFLAQKKELEKMKK
jgi:ABC-type Fe2+-enterobactin transport system substrate-binding protein